MQRLTGSALLTVDSLTFRSKSERVRMAGYVGVKKDGSERLLFTQYYEELLKVKDWQFRHEIRAFAFKYPSKSPAIANLIQAITLRQNYDYRTDSVYIVGNQPGHYMPIQTELNIYHQNKLIAFVDFKNKNIVLRISDGTRSDKERLNRILMHFCGVQLYAKNKVWQVGSKFQEVPVKGCWTEVPFLSTTFSG